MLAAYKNYWKNYFRFHGRATRSDFWSVVLFNCLLLVITFGISFILLISSIDAFLASQMKTLKAGLGLFSIIYQLVNFYLLITLIPNLSLQCRRIIDTGLNRWWCLLVAGSCLISWNFIGTLIFHLGSGAGQANFPSLFLLWLGMQVALFVINLFPTDTFAHD